MIDFTAKIKEEDFNNLKSDLQRMSLTGKQKRKIIKWTLGRIKSNSQKNIRTQTDIKGKKYKHRKNPNDHRKMLRKILRLISIEAYTTGEGEFFYKVKRTGEIANHHQEGIDEVMTADKLKKKNSKKSKGNDMNDPCTKQQAKTLINLGYRKRIGKYKNGNKKGKTKYKKYTVRELREKLTIQWASILIGRRRKQMKTGKTMWIKHIPARSFLDVDDERNAKILEELIQKFVTGEYQ